VYKKVEWVYRSSGNVFPTEFFFRKVGVGGVGFASFLVVNQKKKEERWFWM
jgi:hypothetical protein